DAAVAAGGVTAWELAFMGVPSLLMVLARNQERNAAGLAEAGAALNLGEFERVAPETLAAALGELLDDPARRRRMSRRGRRLIDGRGVERVVGRLRAARPPA